SSSFPDSPTSALSTLSLHDALPIYIALACVVELRGELELQPLLRAARVEPDVARDAVARHTLGHELQLSDGMIRRILHATGHREDRKSTRLNSSHRTISYAVFCLKK